MAGARRVHERAEGAAAEGRRADAGGGEAHRDRVVSLTERLALSVEEAAELLGISRDLAYDLVARREIPSVRLGRRLVVPRRALEGSP